MLKRGGPRKFAPNFRGPPLFNTRTQGGFTGKNSDSSVSQLSALATLRPIWGRVGQGAFELSLPQIRSFFFCGETLACLDISTKKICL